MADKSCVSVLVVIAKVFPMASYLPKGVECWRLPVEIVDFTDDHATTMRLTMWDVAADVTFAEEDACFFGQCRTSTYKSVVSLNYYGKTDVSLPRPHGKDLLAKYVAAKGTLEFSSAMAPSCHFLRDLQSGSCGSFRAFLAPVSISATSFYDACAMEVPRFGRSAHCGKKVQLVEASEQYRCTGDHVKYHCLKQFCLHNITLCDALSSVSFTDFLHVAKFLFGDVSANTVAEHVTSSSLCNSNLGIWHYVDAIVFRNSDGKYRCNRIVPVGCDLKLIPHPLSATLHLSAMGTNVLPVTSLTLTKHIRHLGGGLHVSYCTLSALFLPRVVLLPIQQSTICMTLRNEQFCLQRQVSAKSFLALLFAWWSLSY